MFSVLTLIRALLSWMRGFRTSRDAEIRFLRQQLLILRQSAPARLRLRNSDRLIFVWLCRLFPSLLDATVIFRPETLVRWHRSGFRLFWRWKSRRQAGRPAVSSEIRSLVQQMSRENPLWGAPRIHGELLKLGIDISQSSVAKYMERRRGPPSQGWKTFLRNHAPHIAAVDLFIVPTIGCRLLYGLAILRLDRRHLVWTNVTTNPTAEWIARQITEAFPWDQVPRYLIRDRDRAYGTVVTQRLRAMGIRDRPIAPRSPWQDGYVERVIGSIRRECLDHVIIFDEAHLRRILAAYATYYNDIRTHLALGKGTYRPARSVRRSHRRDPYPGRPASPLCSDGINGRDNPLLKLPWVTPIPLPLAGLPPPQGRDHHSLSRPTGRALLWWSTHHGTVSPQRLLSPRYHEVTSLIAGRAPGRNARSGHMHTLLPATFRDLSSPRPVPRSKLLCGSHA